MFFQIQMVKEIMMSKKDSLRIHNYPISLDFRKGLDILQMFAVMLHCMIVMWFCAAPATLSPGNPIGAPLHTFGPLSPEKKILKILFTPCFPRFHQEFPNLLHVSPDIPMNPQVFGPFSFEGKLFNSHQQFECVRVFLGYTLYFNVLKVPRVIPAQIHVFQHAFTYC